MFAVRKHERWCHIEDKVDQTVVSMTKHVHDLQKAARQITAPPCHDITIYRHRGVLPWLVNMVCNFERQKVRRQYGFCHKFSRTKSFPITLSSHMAQIHNSLAASLDFTAEEISFNVEYCSNTFTRLTGDCHRVLQELVYRLVVA